MSYEETKITVTLEKGAGPKEIKAILNWLNILIEGYEEWNEPYLGRKDVVVDFFEGLQVEVHELRTLEDGYEGDDSFPDRPQYFALASSGYSSGFSEYFYWDKEGNMKSSEEGGFYCPE